MPAGWSSARGWAGVTAALAVGLCALAISQAQPQQLWAALQRIGWGATLAGAAACLLALGLRGLRWRAILGQLGHGLGHAQSLRIFVAGITLSWTPGKLGELTRSVLLRPHGVPWSDSLGAFVADRASDVLGVLLLGLVAQALAQASLTGFGGALGVGTLASLGLAAALRRDALPARLRRLGVPLIRWADLWRARRVLPYCLVSMLAFGLHAAVFAAYARELAPEVSLAACVSAYAMAIFVGAASLVPAGLGAMELALVLALTALRLSWSDAVAVTLLARLNSLWIPSLLGVLTLLGLVRGAARAKAAPV